MTIITEGKQIYKLIGRGLWKATPHAITSLEYQNGLDVSADFTNEVPTGSDTLLGIITNINSSGKDKVYLRNHNDTKAIYYTVGGITYQVYARWNVVGPVWTLLFKYLNNSGIEQPITVPGNLTGVIPGTTFVDYHYVKTDYFANILPTDEVDNFQSIDEGFSTGGGGGVPAVDLNETTSLGDAFIAYPGPPAAPGQWTADALSPVQTIKVYSTVAPDPTVTIGTKVFENLEIRADGVSVLEYVTSFSWAGNVATFTLNIVNLGYSLDATDTVEVEYFA